MLIMSARRICGILLYDVTKDDKYGIIMEADYKKKLKLLNNQRLIHTHSHVLPMLPQTMELNTSHLVVTREKSFS